MADEHKPVWTSLEVTKLIVAILTPVTVAYFGYLFQQQITNQNSIAQQQIAIQTREWQSQQRLLERRLQVYDAIRVELNRIYCFIEDVGTWKDDTPATVVRYKRDIDQTMYSQSALWSADTVQAYKSYMDAAFEPYQGIGVDAKIKTSAWQKKVGVPGWQEAWSEKLTGSLDEAHRQKYDKLISLISRDLSFPSEQSMK
jgi:hypothetical protein